jgi:protein-tyrosine-phosphatase
MNILFICKYNRFRSKIAESVFNKLNKNKNHKAKSAGIIKGSYPLDKNQVKEAKRQQILLKGYPQGITTDLLRWQEMIIIVANDVPSLLFKENLKYNKKVAVWSISDAKTDNKKEIAGIIKKIKQKITKLTEEIT